MGEQHADHPSPAPLTCLKEHTPFFPTGVQGFHVPCAPPSKSQSCIYVMWGGSSFSQEEKAPRAVFLGRCFQPLQQQRFPNQSEWRWHKEWSQILVLAFFPVHYLRPLLLALNSLLHQEASYCPSVCLTEGSSAVTGALATSGLSLKKKKFRTTWGPFLF